MITSPRFGALRLLRYAYELDAHRAKTSMDVEVTEGDTTSFSNLLTPQNPNLVRLSVFTDYNGVTTLDINNQHPEGARVKGDVYHAEAAIALMSQVSYAIARVTTRIGALY